MKRRDVKRSYELSDINQGGSITPSIRSRSGAKRSGSVLKKLLKYSPYIIIGTIILYILFFSSLFQISRVDVQGPNATLSQTLDKEVNNYLNSRLLARNWVFLNSSDLKSFLQKTFTGQETITVDKKFPNRLVVSTDEQKPALIWKTGSHSYILSTNGRAITEQNKQSSSDLPVVYDNTNLPVDVGSKVTGRDFANFVTSIGSFLKDNKIDYEKIYVSDTTSELNVQTKQGYTIKFSTLLKPDSQTRSLKATLDLMAQQNKKASSYIDLRVDGRAFYK